MAILFIRTRLLAFIDKPRVKVSQAVTGASLSMVVLSPFAEIGQAVHLMENFLTTRLHPWLAFSGTHLELYKACLGSRLLKFGLTIFLKARHVPGKLCLVLEITQSSLQWLGNTGKEIIPIHCCDKRYLLNVVGVPSNGRPVR